MFFFFTFQQCTSDEACVPGFKMEALIEPGQNQNASVNQQAVSVLLFPRGFSLTGSQLSVSEISQTKVRLCVIMWMLFKI